MIARKQWIAEVLEAPELETRELVRVVTGQALAVRVPLLDPAIAAEVARRLWRDSDWSRYETESAAGIMAHGKALFDCADRSECDTYFESADDHRERIRACLAGLPNPIESMQIALDRAWESGATLLRIGGRRCHVGLLRGFYEGGEALPHVDACAWDYPCEETVSCTEQLALNVYLETPTRGGELQLWDIRPSRREYERLRLGDSYGLDRQRLPPPRATIAPRVGELIVFNASRIHAVLPSTGRPRLTVSCFANMSSMSAPLRIFS